MRDGYDLAATVRRLVNIMELAHTCPDKLIRRQLADNLSDFFTSGIGFRPVSARPAKTETAAGILALKAPLPRKVKSAVTFSFAPSLVSSRINWLRIHPARSLDAPEPARRGARFSLTA